MQFSVKQIQNLEIVVLPSYLLVDDGWGEWGKWSSCGSDYCLVEPRTKTRKRTRTRTRTCSNPASQSGRRDCSGENIDTTICGSDTSSLLFCKSNE